MNVRNLFIYHCSNEVFKILKFRNPFCLFEKFVLSGRIGKETQLLTPQPSLNFTYEAGIIWNAVKSVLKFMIFSLKVSFYKLSLKKLILKTQAKGNTIERDSSPN